jgi:ABC-type cobalamin/Fe3+-siderophores transport system ATPase subunit
MDIENTKKNQELKNWQNQKLDELVNKNIYVRYFDEIKDYDFNDVWVNEIKNKIKKFFDTLDKHIEEIKSYENNISDKYFSIIYKDVSELLLKAVSDTPVIAGGQVTNPISNTTYLIGILKNIKILKNNKLELENINSDTSINKAKIIQIEQSIQKLFYSLKVIHELVVNFFMDSLNEIKFNFNFFKNLNFFESNMVIVGTNGSGKTTLTEKLKKTIQAENSGVVISAVRIMLFNNFDSINTDEISIMEFNKLNDKLKTSKIEAKYMSSNNEKASSVDLLEEFNKLLQLLISKQIKENENYRKTDRMNKIETELEKIMKLWNDLIKNKELSYHDMNLYVTNKIINREYEAYNMSDGEKSILFIAGYVLLASQNSFIIIDEPELHLHKSIVDSMFDKLEQERNDCIFIYMTHDVDFATSRNNAKKFWLKNYSNYGIFDIESIDENEIPQELYLKLLGSKKPILFCEGKKDSWDYIVYSKLLPNFTVTPVEGCLNVIEYTKKFNELVVGMKYKPQKAYGLIDKDFEFGDEKNKELQENNIYRLDYAEIENLFLTEDFLNEFKKEERPPDDDCIINLKNKIIAQLEKKVEEQTSKYIENIINGKRKSMCGNKNLDEIKRNFEKPFNIEFFEIEKKYNDRKQMLKEYIKNEDYSSIIKIYNNKGLIHYYKGEFSLGKQWKEKIIRFLSGSDKVIEILKNFLPKDLVDLNDKQDIF